MSSISDVIGVSAMDSGLELMAGEPLEIGVAVVDNELTLRGRRGVGLVLAMLKKNYRQVREQRAKF